MALIYVSGQEVKPGDRVLYAGEPGQIEFVAEQGHPQTGYYFEQFGAGCMILTPGYGRVFEKPNEDLEFISRRGDAAL
jgi:hypothetical protein